MTKYWIKVVMKYPGKCLVICYGPNAINATQGIFSSYTSSGLANMHIKQYKTNGVVYLSQLRHFDHIYNNPSTARSILFNICCH